MRSGTLHTQTARFQSHAGDESGRSARHRLLETMRSFGSARLVLALTGQESQAAVVLAALIVAALFQPLRARVQTLLDRRFYRRKYDVARTLDQFANRMKDDVQLDQLAAGLVAVVRETMQPTTCRSGCDPPRAATQGQSPAHERAGPGAETRHPTTLAGGQGRRNAARRAATARHRAAVDLVLNDPLVGYLLSDGGVVELDAR